MGIVSESDFRIFHPNCKSYGWWLVCHSHTYSHSYKERQILRAERNMEWRDWVYTYAYIVETQCKVSPSLLIYFYVLGVAH